MSLNKYIIKIYSSLYIFKLKLIIFYFFRAIYFTIRYTRTTPDKLRLLTNCAKKQLKLVKVN
jgi:hypothetical protein